MSHSLEHGPHDILGHEIKPGAVITYGRQDGHRVTLGFGVVRRAEVKSKEVREWGGKRRQVLYASLTVDTWSPAYGVDAGKHHIEKVALHKHEHITVLPGLEEAWLRERFPVVEEQ